jgi:hypothetical protein
MFLAMLSLFRERLPCSENYWRYKRNYEIHMQILNRDRQKSPSSDSGDGMMVCEENKSTEKKVLAASHMSFLKPLTHYNEDDIHRKMSVGNVEP